VEIRATVLKTGGRSGYEYIFALRERIRQEEDVLALGDKCCSMDVSEMGMLSWRQHLPPARQRSYCNKTPAVSMVNMHQDRLEETQPYCNR